jgi:hypothetical protein
MIRLFCGCFHSSNGDIRMLKVKVPCRASSGCRLPNSHAQYNSTRARTAVHLTGLRVFFRMFLYVINRVIAPYIFSEIKTDYKSSESTSFLSPRGVAGPFVHLTHANHLPALLYQSCLTVHPFVCNKDRSWLRHDVVQNRARVCVSPQYGTFAGCG